jgi:uncharacterized membrane protein YeaQ/YmgE (transglycosylase-associated protein family)
MKKTFASLLFQTAAFALISLLLLGVNALYSTIAFDARLIIESGPAVALQALLLSGVFAAFHALRIGAGSLRSVFVATPIVSAIFALSIYVMGMISMPEAAFLGPTKASKPLWNKFVEVDGVNGFLGKSAEGYFVPVEGEGALAIQPIPSAGRIEGIPPRGDLQGLPAFIGDWARDASVSGEAPSRALNEGGMLFFGAHCLIMGLLARGLGAFARASKWPLLNIILALIGARLATWVLSAFTKGAVLDFFASLVPGAGAELWTMLAPGLVACGLLLWEAASVASAKGKAE